MAQVNPFDPKLSQTQGKRRPTKIRPRRSLTLLRVAQERGEEGREFLPFHTSAIESIRSEAAVNAM